ncbi:MAG: 2-oxoglutarate dehydrogenase, E2 component, dihydrolipoamide succinyltransferase [Promicromonosporaceae bacterium]|nr:2-oxoglutarate dehydrogenase, E2 component, dihydrolipoamide succinyltransferase [Promicromonosporaceae bacterium]
MAQNVTLPALGESVTEAQVTRWLKAVGDVVTVGESLLEVSTDKVDSEVPSPYAGVLIEIVAAEDAEVQVGDVLAVIEGDGSAPAAPATPESQAAPAAAEAPAGVTEVTVVLPELGESVTEAQVTRWLKDVGDDVAVGESLLEVSTDKVDSEIPSTVAGRLVQIVAAEDAIVSPGDALALIAGTAPAAPGAAGTPDALASPGAPASTASLDGLRGVPAPHDTAGQAQADGGAPYATPLVKQIAAEYGLNLAAIQGSGVGGRITKDDVLAAAAGAQAAPPPAAPGAPLAVPSSLAAAPGALPLATPPLATTSAPASGLLGKTEKMSRMRAIIAERMVEALHTQAQLTTAVEVDVTSLARLRAASKEAFRAREGANLTFLPFYALAALRAARSHPMVNATISPDGTEVTYHAAANLGIAVDTDRGLMVPVIKDAQNLSLAGLARAIGDLGARTKAGKVTAEELQGGTFTITNTGSGGSLFDTPIVPVGQSAILGTGTITKRPGVIEVDGQDVIAIRQYAYLFLSYDHRLVDGADAARFLMAVKRTIEAAGFAGEIGG